MQLARRSPANTAISIVWALVPLMTCGVGTPFTMAYGAYRRRAPMMAVAALLYFLSLFFIFVVVVAYYDVDELPDWAALVVVVGLFTNWIGGTIHSLAIRSMVFAPHAVGHAPAPFLPPPPHAYPSGPYPPPSYPPRPAPQYPPQQRPPHTAPQQHPQGPTRPVGPGRPQPPYDPRQQHNPWPGPAGHHQQHPAPPQPQPRPQPQDHRPSDAVGRSAPPAGPGQSHGSSGPVKVTPSGDVPPPANPISTNPPVPGPVTSPGPASTPSVQGASTLPSQTPRPLPAGEPDHIGRYRLIGTLGQGGQGAVYLAETPEGLRVAIKVLHARLASETGAQQRFLREVEAARRVAPFSTARVIDADIADDRLFIVSEYVEGSSLEQLVREQGPRGHDGLVRLALGTAGALAAIHRAGIVHRDFKPSNVLIGADGPRVVDFGIARVLDNATATSSGVLGTPAYMSPEQVSGERVGPESDVFSWAATIVFAATGRPAFGEDNIAAVFNRIFTKQPDLSALPDSLAQVIGKCLEKRPENRPTASDVMLAIVH